MRVTVPTTAATTISSYSIGGVRRRSTIGRQIVLKGGISAAKRLAAVQVGVMLDQEIQVAGHPH
ncbi:MAG TPA: hypothetical protein VLN61_10485 [Pseudolabrys sp.]|nr:hypothetical protein [Pseudolabrys sp.]